MQDAPDTVMFESNKINSFFPRHLFGQELSNMTSVRPLYLLNQDDLRLSFFRGYAEWMLGEVLKRARQNFHTF